MSINLRQVVFQLFFCYIFISVTGQNLDTSLTEKKNTSVYDKKQDSVPSIKSSIFYNVRQFGAKGDSAAFDTDAINRAIDAAASAGGGTIYFPAGKYLSFSIRLKNNITLFLDNGAVLIAADPNQGKGGYDAPEPNAWDKYQDFGHSHWHNSLICGENLQNISITGPGVIN